MLVEGILYLLGHDAESKMHQLIDKMFALSREAVGCSAISAWSNRADEGEFWVDTVRLLASGRMLTRSLVLRHDSHPGVTLCLHREARA